MNNSIKYTVNQLFKIANPKGNIDYSIDIDLTDRKIVINIDDSNKKIIFNLVRNKAWYDLIENKFQKLHWIDNAKNIRKLPILFWVDEDLPFVNLNDKEVIFNGDIISSTFFMLSRWEERVIVLLLKQNAQN